jgi:transposase
LRVPSGNLPDDPETLKAMLLAERHESERLRQIIKELQCHRFGRKAETLAEEQMLLGLEDVQQDEAFREAGQDETASEGRTERAQAPQQSGRTASAFAAGRIVVDLDDKTCPCCKGDLAPDWRGQERERLDMVPAQFRVIVTRPPKYACRACEDDVMQAEAPARLMRSDCRPKQPSPVFWCPSVVLRPRL